MKLWTMPRIVVGQFRPNEYVAACVGLVKPNIGADDWWDQNGDGRWQRDSEEIKKSTSNDWYGVDSDISLGPKGSRNFYHHDKITYPLPSSLYTSTVPILGGRYFTDLGSYYVYVFESGKAYLYDREMSFPYAPSTTKSFSS